VVLRYFLDMDERAMSTVLGVPTGTVKWRLHQARKKLRGALEDGSRLQSRLIGEVQEP
jgi:DNA-directed RNA polymerase specialized sigma24 family protein